MGVLEEHSPGGTLSVSLPPERGPRRRPSMDDQDWDSTWEEDEEDDDEGPSAGGDEHGEAGGPGDADAEDDDEDEEEPRPRALQSRMMGSRNRRAMQDTHRYRHHYPDLVERDGNGDMPNLSFYRNEIRFLPNGCFIEDILLNWKDKYDLLEDNHSYIQWLFPLREPGVNWHAKPLTLREVEEFKSSKEVRERFVQAYELMLGFYGIQLEDRDTGKVCRAQNYEKRFQNLNGHSHNNLRITRILKSLGELGLERYQAPLARFFLEETLVHGKLPGVRQSALDYFVFTVRCRHQRRKLLHFAWEHFEPRSKFVWGPHDKLKRFRPHSPPRPPLRVGPRQTEVDESPGDSLLASGARGWTCEPRKDKEGDSVAPGSQPGSAEPQEASALERDQEDEARGCREEGPEPSSPKESKKRKLEVNRPEQAPGEQALQGASEVEKIALNLEGCALSQGSLQAGTQEMSSQDPGEVEQPCPQPSVAKVADEARKRRKVDQGTEADTEVVVDTEVVAGGEAPTPAPTWPPAPSGRPEAREGENGVKEEAEGYAGPEQGAPQSPVAAGPTADEKAVATEVGPSAEPPKS